jgi:hypothetical protein
VFLRARAKLTSLLREALANAIIHGNYDSPKKSMFVAAVNLMKSQSL